MSQPISAKLTAKGLLIPRAAIREWLDQDLDVFKEGHRIIIRPRLEAQAEAEQVYQVLEDAGLLLPPEPLPADYQPLSPQTKAELAQKFSASRPLSELVIEERNNRV